MDIVELEEALQSTQRVLNRGLDEVNQCIDELDLKPIKIKLCSTHEDGGLNWPQDGANAAIAEYRLLLKQFAKSYQQPNDSQIPLMEHIANFPQPSSLSPRVIDIVWHTHILFTRKYFEDCKKIFGFYHHHQPEIKFESTT